MASSVQHDGVLESDKVYTHLAIARIVGRNANWVIKLIYCLRVHNIKIGAIYFISGADFMRAIERCASFHDDTEPESGGPDLID